MFLSLQNYAFRFVFQSGGSAVVKDIANKEFDKGVSVYHDYALHQTTFLLKEFFCTAMEYSKLDELKVQYDFNPVKSVLQNINLTEFIEIIGNKDVPVYKVGIIYYYLYEILVNGKDDEYLEKLETMFIGNEDKYEEELRFNISNYMEHYYMNKYNQYELKNVKTFFNLQRNKLVNGRIADIVQLHREIFFDNYVEIGLKAGENNYVKEFIKLNIDSLPEKVKDLYSVIAKVRLFIFRKKYREALEEIESNRKYIHNVLILTRLLMVEYELNMIEESLLEADRIKHLLRRSKSLNENQKNRVSIFISNFIKLTKLKDNPESKKLDEFMFTLNKIKLSLPAFDWFREKVEVMKRKK